MWVLAVLVTCILQSLSIKLSQPHQSLYCLSKLPDTEASRSWKVPKGIRSTGVEPSDMVCVPQGSKLTSCPGNSQLLQGYWEFGASCPLNHLPGPHGNLPRLSPKIYCQAKPSQKVSMSFIWGAWLYLHLLHWMLSLRSLFQSFAIYLLPSFYSCLVFLSSAKFVQCSWVLIYIVDENAIQANPKTNPVEKASSTWWVLPPSTARSNCWVQSQPLPGVVPKSKSQNIMRHLPSTPSRMFRACQALSHP